MNDETAEIHATLNELGAPNEWTRKPYQKSATAPTISERIRGLHLALTEATERVVFEVKEARRLLSQHATGDTLADMARSLVERHAEAIRQRDEQVLIRGRAEAREADAEERAATFEGAFQSANVSNAKLLHEIHDLRAETQRLQAQLDYATELHLSAMRARA